MRHRRLFAALIALPLATAACTATAQSAPPPTGTTTSAAAPPSSPAATPGSGPPAAPGATTQGKDACLGAVMYSFDPGTTGTWPKPCIEVGGVVRITPHGPADFSAAPRARVDCFYAAGVHQCRLIGTGSVAFTTSIGRVLTVTVVPATSPPRPSTECQLSGEYVLDAADGGPPWPAICLKTSVTLRIENHGPGGVTAAPAKLVSCHYEAGVRDCRLLAAGTVRLSVVNPEETRTLNIVIIK